MSAAPLHSGNIVIDTLFRLCVDLLMWLAELLGVSYFTINIWIFCVLWPALTVALAVTVIRQRRTIRKLTGQLNNTSR